MFGLKDSFMMGSEDVPKTSNPLESETISFIFDSVHEAADFLTKNNQTLFHDYDAAINYIKRQVCAEDQFFCGILGASAKVYDKEAKKEIYLSLTEAQELPLAPSKKERYIDPAFGQRSGRLAYYGIETAVIENKDYKDKLKARGILAHGQFDSINSARPCTPFIRERRDSAQDYIDSVKRVAHGVVFGALS
jgi:hypothetical protein